MKLVNIFIKYANKEKLKQSRFQKMQKTAREK